MDNFAIARNCAAVSYLYVCHYLIEPDVYVVFAAWSIAGVVGGPQQKTRPASSTSVTLMHCACVMTPLTLYWHQSYMYIHAERENRAYLDEN